MWWRALLAAAVVACTVTHALGPQQLDHIKDVLCVMLLNSIKKEDLDSIRQGLQNVNISGNNEELNNIGRIIDLTSNKTQYLTIHKNEGNISNNVEHKNIQTQTNRSQERNKNNEKIDKSRTEKYIQDQKINCSSVMDYSNGQPKILSIMHFFRNCLNISRPTEHNNKGFSYENASVTTQLKNDFNYTQKEFAPPQETAEEINKKHTDTLSEERGRYDQQNVHDFYQNVFPSRRDADKNLNQYYGDININDLNEEPSKYMNKEDSLTTNNSVDINSNNLQNRLVNTVKVTESSDKTRSTNSLNYGEYKESNNLNGNRDLTNIKELKRYYKSGYGNIFYTFNESYGNALETVLGPFQDIIKSLVKTPSSSTLDDSLGGKQSNLDTIAKIHDMLKYLQNTIIERVNSLDNRPSTEVIERRLIKNQSPTTAISKQKETERIRRDFTTIPTTNAEFSVSTLHFVNYVPSSINISNEAKFTGKIIPKSFNRIFDMNNNNYYNYGDLYLKKATEIDKTNDIPKGYYFYPKTVAIERVIKNQETEPYKSETRSQFFRNMPEAKHNKLSLFEPLNNDLKSASEEVASVSSIHYINYLYPAENIKSLSNFKDSMALKLSPQLPKEYIISREAAEHNYYQYEKVNVVDNKHNLHPSVYFHPEISSNKLDTMKPRLSRMYFTPNMHKRGNDKLEDYAFKILHDSSMKNIPITADASFSRNVVEQNVDSVDSKFAPYMSMPLTRKLEQIKTLDIITCTQKYANVTDIRRNSNVIRNESVTTANENLFPKNMMTDIAESIKEDILQDLRKELNIPSSIKSTTTLRPFPALIFTSTTKVSEINMQTVHTSHEIVTQDTVLEKIMKFLEQMNASKNSPSNINDFEMKNMKMLDKGIEMLTTETYLRKKPSRKYKPTNGDYNFALQNHRNKITVQNEIQRQTEYKLKEKIIMEPKTFQTNALEISPLGVYVDSLISPINQNIIIPPSRKESDKVDRSYKMNYYKQKRKEETIQNSPFVLNHYYPVQNPLPNLRAKEHNYINMHTTNINFENKHKSEEHKDVKYLDNKFLNNIVKDSSALHPSIRDCCNQKHVSQLMYECCNDKVASRRQKPLIMNNPSDELSYSNFLQSQHKVNAMLAKVLASKNKFHSVETI